MVEVICETVESNDVVVYDKSRFNSNNHWEGEPPVDYIDKLKETKTRNWIDSFRSSYETIEMDSADIAWMKRAAEIGKSTGMFSKCFQEELDDTIIKYKEIESKIFKKDENGNTIGYFVRTDNVSLKCGQHGVGPYYNLRKILESSCSCIHGHSPVDHTTKKLKYYILPWINIDKDKEFRVFVCNRQITCISSQGVYNINKTLAALSVSQRLTTIRRWIATLVNYINSIKDRITLDSYSIDIALVEKSTTDVTVNDVGRFDFTFF